MKIASLDLGSNSFLLLISEAEGGMIKKVLCDEVEIVRMSEGVHHSRQICEAALNRIDACFEKFHNLIVKHKVDKIVSVATSAARDVENAQSFYDLGQKWDIPINIISGDKEAELTYKGSATSGFTGSVVDVGGGSTEIIQSNFQGKVKACSIDIGAVRLYEIFICSEVVPQETLKKMDQYIFEKLKESPIVEGSSAGGLMAVAGTPTTLAMMIQGIEFDSEQINGFEVSLQELLSWRNRLAQMSLSEKKLVPGLAEKRADIIVVGLSILAAVVQYLNLNKITVSTQGVRYGLAMESSD